MDTVSTDDAVSEVGAPGRLAEPDEGITLDELRLASRNHAMPREAMRDDVTPVGLHYVLTHYDVPAVDSGTWRLAVGGCVEQELSVDLESLTALPSRTVRVTLECAGNGRATLTPRPISQPWLEGAVGTADWTGVPLADLLRAATPTSEAVDVVFTGADHGFDHGVEQDYQRGLPLAEAMAADVLVAFQMNGSPLPVPHGFPVRLVVPGWYGMAHVKWLRGITLIDHPFDGYQNSVAYRIRQAPDEPGEPVTRIEPRALLVPPGHPDFMTRQRFVRAGQLELEGRAWSGWGPIERVEVSTDDGRTWADAELGPADHPWAWRRFTSPWTAAPGRHVLRVKAHDRTGRVQSDEPRWNQGGFTNNCDQPVIVHVLDA
jgi:DMSO/TMAO reductase YedYZ molybdopterin-dependent catalytic subunit